MDTGKANLLKFTGTHTREFNRTHTLESQGKESKSTIRYGFQTNELELQLNKVCVPQGMLYQLPAENLVFIDEGHCANGNDVTVLAALCHFKKETTVAVKKQSASGSKTKRGPAKVKAGVLKTSPVKQLPKNAVEASVWSTQYRHTYTTGPFSLPLATHSIDWGILNNSRSPQKVRITVFKCVTGSVKTAEPPGPLELTIQPGETTHNANSASGGFFYEIQVECNSRRVFPYASAWSGSVADPIPGSVVKSAEFIRRLG